MVIFRWLSLVLIVLAVMLLGADLVGTLEKKAVFVRSLQDVILLFDYDTKQVLTANAPWPEILLVANAIIDTPSWVTLSVIAFFFAIIAPSTRHVRPLPPPPPIPR
jgi:hypothetical protein